MGDGLGPIVGDKADLEKVGLVLRARTLDHYVAEVGVLNVATALWALLALLFGLPVLRRRRAGRVEDANPNTEVSQQLGGA